MQDIFVAAIVHKVHAIWMARNVLRFSSEKISLHEAKAKIISSMALSGNILKGNCLPYSSDLSLLDSFMIDPSSRRFKDITSVVHERFYLMLVSHERRVPFVTDNLHVFILLCDSCSHPHTIYLFLIVFANKENARLACLIILFIVFSCI